MKRSKGERAVTWQKKDRTEKMNCLYEKGKKRSECKLSETSDNCQDQQNNLLGLWLMYEERKMPLANSVALGWRSLGTQRWRDWGGGEYIVFKILAISFLCPNFLLILFQNFPISNHHMEFHWWEKRPHIPWLFWILLNSYIPNVLYILDTSHSLRKNPCSQLPIILFHVRHTPKSLGTFKTEVFPLPLLPNRRDLLSFQMIRRSEG